eukprot:tig00000605_g2500.t1
MAASRSKPNHASAAQPATDAGSSVATDHELEQMYIVGLHTRGGDAKAHVEKVKEHARARARTAHGSGSDARHAAFHHTYRRAVRGFSARLSPEVRSALAAHEDVKYIVPVGLVRPAQLPPDVTTILPSLWPWNATVRPWHLDRLDQASNVLDGRFAPGSLTGAGVDIYVLDTGVRESHPELVGRTVRLYDVDGGNSSSSAFAADCDAGLHGTAVASVAAGASVGPAPQATVLAAKVFRRVTASDPNSACKATATDADVVGAIDAVLASMQSPSRAGRRAVVLMGFASTAPSDALANAVNGAYVEAIASLRAAGAVVVTAAGNEDKDACRYAPGNSLGAINVGASDQDDFRAGFSNWGTCVSLLAPGQNIRAARARFSMTANPSYFDAQPAVPEMNAAPAIDHFVAHGTSYAAALTAGLAALYREAFPAADAAAVEAALLDGALPVLDAAGLKGTLNRLASATRLGFPGMAAQPGPAAYNYSALSAPVTACSNVQGSTAGLWSGPHHYEQSDWPNLGSTVLDPLPSTPSKRRGVYLARFRVESELSAFALQLSSTDVLYPSLRLYVGNPLLPSHTLVTYAGTSATFSAEGSGRASFAGDVIKSGTYYVAFQGSYVPGMASPHGRWREGPFSFTAYDSSCPNLTPPLTKSETCSFPFYDMLECGSIFPTITTENEISRFMPPGWPVNYIWGSLWGVDPNHGFKRHAMARVRLPYSISAGSLEVAFRTQGVKGLIIYDRCPDVSSFEAAQRGKLTTGSYIGQYGSVWKAYYELSGGVPTLTVPPELLAGEYYVMLMVGSYGSGGVEPYRPVLPSRLNYPNKAAYCTQGIVPPYRPFCPAAVPTVNAPFCNATRARLVDWPLASSLGFPVTNGVTRAILLVSDVRRSSSSIYFSICSLDLDFVPTLYAYVGCPTEASSRLVKTATTTCDMTISEAFYSLLPDAPLYIVVEGFIAADSNRTGNFAALVSDAYCANGVGAGPWPRPPSTPGTGSGTGGSGTGGTGGAQCPTVAPPTDYYTVQCPGTVELERLEALAYGGSSSVCAARMPDLKQLLVSFGNWSGGVSLTQSPPPGQALLPAVAAPVSSAWSTAGLPSSGTGVHAVSFAIQNESGAGPRGSCAFSVKVVDVGGPFEGAVCPPRARDLLVPSGQCTVSAPDLRGSVLFAPKCLRHVAADASAVQSIPPGTQLTVGQSYALKLYSSRYPAGASCPVSLFVQRASAPAFLQQADPEPSSLSGVAGGRPALVPVQLRFAMSDGCPDHAAACRVAVRATGDALLGAGGVELVEGAPYHFWNQTCREDFSTIHLSPYVAPGSYSGPGEVVRTYRVRVRCAYGAAQVQQSVTSLEWAIPVLSP